MKEFAELKELITEKMEDLQSKINELEKELDSYKNILIKIDSVLEKESFKTAADLYGAENIEIKQKSPPQKPTESDMNKEYEIKSEEDKLIGKMLVEKELITITANEIISIPENAPPFKNFFIGRIIQQMEDEDNEAIKNGKLDEDKIINCEIIKSSENNVQKIVIKNYRTYNRMIKILNTIGWTFRTIIKPK